MSEPIIGSYVKHANSDLWWNVSTILRSCSSPYAPEMMYNETIVWEWDPDTKIRGKQIEQIGGGLDTHFALCRALHYTGSLPKEVEQ